MHDSVQCLWGEKFLEVERNKGSLIWPPERVTMKTKHVLLRSVDLTEMTEEVASENCIISIYIFETLSNTYF